MGSRGTSWLDILRKNWRKLAVQDKYNDLQLISIRLSDCSTALFTFPSSISCWDANTYPLLLPLFFLVFKETEISVCRVSKMFFQVLTSENTCLKFASCWMWCPLAVWRARGYRLSWQRELAYIAGVFQLGKLSHAELYVAVTRLLYSRASWNVVRHLYRQSAVAENYHSQNVSTSYCYLWMCEYSAKFFLLHKFEKFNT